MDQPHRAHCRRGKRAARAALALAIVGASALSANSAHAEIPVMTGIYTGTNSTDSPMRLGVYDPATTPVVDGSAEYWAIFGKDTTGPYLSYGEDYPAENDLGYTSCSRNYGGFALFTGPNTFAGTHSNTQGSWTLEGTIDDYGNASGTLSATLYSGVNHIPPLQCDETFTVTHPDATDPPDDTSTTSTSTTSPTTTSPTTTSPTTTVSPATSSPSAPTTAAPATPSTLGATGDATAFVAGQTATFTGSGFQPGEPVAGTFYSDPIPMGTVTADAQGRAVFAFVIPTTVVAGQHTVRMVGATSGTVELAVTVLQPLSPALPATGDAHIGTLVAATVLVCIGVVMVGTRRRPDTA
jgi:hypothetical protein